MIIGTARQEVVLAAIRTDTDGDDSIITIQEV